MCEKVAAIILNKGCLMKEVVTNIGTSEDLQTNAQLIGIFIFNKKNEMLLHNVSQDHTSISLWEAPSIVYQQSHTSPATTAHHYLEQLDIDCNLYEAFTLNLANSCNINAHARRGHLIIAITKTSSPEVKSTTNNYKWIPINELLLDIVDHPSNYAYWFRTSLDSGLLYLKSLLKNQVLQPPPPQSELT